MRVFRFLLIFLLVITLFTACSKDEGYSLDKFWVNIATVENPERRSTFFMRLDNNTLLWTAASNFMNYRPVDGQRIVANYTKLWDKRSTGMYDFDVKLNDVYEVLTKGIFHITPATQDSIGNDPIHVERMWIGRHFLNVEFVFQGFDRVHFINLVKDPSKVHTDGKTHLEFRHNANNDAKLFNRWGMASFDISSLQNSAADSVQLVIHVNKPNQSAVKTYELTYRHGRPATAVSSPSPAIRFGTMESGEIQ